MLYCSRPETYILHLLLLSLAAYAVASASFGRGQGPILLDEIGCTGNESTLHFCTHQRVGVHNCEHDDDAGVVCIPGKFNINSCGYFGKVMLTEAHLYR